MPSFTSVYEDTSPFFVYNGDWKAGHSEDDLLVEYSESTFMGTEQNEANLTFQFYGTTVSIIGARRPNHGRYQVSIDGQVYPSESGSATPEIFRDTLFQESLNQALHNVSLVNREDAWLDVDQISWTTRIGTEDEPLIVNTIQDSHPAWVYEPSTAWTTQFPEVGTFSGRSGHGTSTQQALAILTFSGDCIAVFGAVGPNAARAYSVQVDGIAAVRFSATQNYPRSKQLLYWRGGLGPGNHTLQIRKDSPVAGEMLTIDYAEVYTTPSLGGSWEGAAASAVQPSSSSRPSQESATPTGLIIALGIVSAVAGCALLALAVIFFLIRRRKRQAASAASPPPGGSTSLISPFTATGNIDASHSNANLPFIPTIGAGHTPSGTQEGNIGTQPSMAQIQQPQYPVGMMAAVTGFGQPETPSHYRGNSDQDAASSSATAVTSQAPIQNHKAVEALHFRASRRSDAPPAYNFAPSPTSS